MGPEKQPVVKKIVFLALNLVLSHAVSYMLDKGTRRKDNNNDNHYNCSS